MKKEIIDLAKKCINLGWNDRPENQWLENVYDRLREKYGGLKKAQADDLIYTKMYGVKPEKSSDALKIRYWRTGRHIPINRQHCLDFGRALELSGPELKFLLQGYYDKSDEVFEPEHIENNTLYDQRKWMMNHLLEEYLETLHAFYLFKMDVSQTGLRRNLRHWYYTDAKSYFIKNFNGELKSDKHIYSMTYESEFGRQMKLLGEIPRKTMIRHLLIMQMPFISVARMNEYLEYFGYLPLDPAHTLVGGERLDFLILGFLKIYERHCRDKAPKECILWFHKAYGILDSYLEINGSTNLRFLYFKALHPGDK